LWWSAASPLFRVLVLVLALVLVTGGSLVFCHLHGTTRKQEAMAPAASGTAPQPLSADELLAKGRYARAAAAFVARLRERPDDLAARYGLARAQECLGRVEEAWRNYGKACAGDVGARVHLAFARFALSRLRPQTARREAGIAAKLSPDSPEPYFVLARACLAEGDGERAHQAVEKALSCGGQGEEALLLQAQAMFATDHLDEAGDLARRLLATHPDHTEAAALLGTLAKRRGDDEEAERWFGVAGKGLKTATTLREVPLALGSFSADSLGPSRPGSFSDTTATALLARIERAQSLFQRGCRQQAMDEMQELAALYPQVCLCQLQLARMLLQAGQRDEAQRLAAEMSQRHSGDPRPRVLLADIYLEAQLPGLAREQAEAALRLAAGTPYPAAQKALAVALNAEGKTDRAAEAMAAYLQLREGDDAARMLLAMFQMRAGATAAAKASLRRLAEGSPESWILLRVAKLWEGLGEPDEAIGCLRRLLKRDGRSLPVCNSLAFLLARHGQALDEAVALARAARAMAPQDPHVADTLGYCLLRSGDVAQAMPFLRTCVAQVPGSPVFHYHLGLALHRAAQVPEAIAELRAALALSASFPDAPDTRRLLDRLVSGRED
jgi:tetratricopeptide (TPR) repeat protein